MKTKYILAILGTLLVMAVFFYKDRSAPTMTAAESLDVPDATISVQLSNRNDATKIIEKQAADGKAIKDKTSQGITEEQIAEIQKNFSGQLKLMGACLGIQPQVDSEKIAPSFENLSASLKPALGELVVRMDDWSQQDLKYPDGSMKRIRNEYEYQDNGNPVRRTQLYKINDQGMPEMQPLNPAQATDPSEEFLNSLVADGQEILQEKGGRVYYQQGEELVLVERTGQVNSLKNVSGNSGQIQSFSLTKGDKTFSCTETDSVTSNCQCL